MKIKNLVAAAGMALALVAVAPSAQATSIAPCGSSHSIGSPGDETDFFGIAIAGGGAGSCVINFTSSYDGLDALASATIESIPFGTFTNLVMSWISNFDNWVLGSIAIVPDKTQLSTTFVLPWDLSQRLVLSWDDSVEGAGFDYSVAVQPIPIPGALPLLATGLVGLGFLTRRRKAA